jgi:hypothetical protein
VTTRCPGPIGLPTQTAELTILPVPVNVVPAGGRPGQKVTVQVDCDKAGGAVSSAVLTADVLRPNPNGHQPWAMWASGTVNANAKPGTYRVSAVCGERTLDGTFNVLKPQVLQQPTGPVQTGGGGTAP